MATENIHKDVSGLKGSSYKEIGYAGTVYNGAKEAERWHDGKRGIDRVDIDCFTS